MDINNIGDRLQERIFWIIIISIMTFGIVMLSSQIRQCSTNEHTSFATCVSAGGDALQCCVATKNFNCDVYKKEGE